MQEAIIRLELEPLEEGGFVATSPDVPGLVAQGRTIAETCQIAQELVPQIAESYIEHGDGLPPSLANVIADNTEIEFRVTVIAQPA
jgi:antitoxin HicB